MLSSSPLCQPERRTPRVLLVLVGRHPNFLLEQLGEVGVVGVADLVRHGVNGKFGRLKQLLGYGDADLDDVTAKRDPRLFLEQASQIIRVKIDDLR